MYSNQKSQIGSRKRVTPDGEREENREYTPLKKSKNFELAAIRRYLIKNLKADQVEAVEKEFKARGFSDQFLSDFLEQEHREIFSWLLIESLNTRSFQFILNTFSREALQRKLKETNFSSLNIFLKERAALEGLGLLSQEKRNLDVEKFKLLFAIDPEGTQHFIKEANDKRENFIKPSLLEDYSIALEKYCEDTAKTQRAIKNQNLV
jgi:hypothetical protein